MEIAYTELSLMKKFTKILFSEKIYIGERIRDVKFYNNLIILTFERGLDLGILKKKLEY